MPYAKLCFNHCWTSSSSALNRFLAEEQAQARATQQAIAELAAQEACTRELSQAAEANLEDDPELSMLLSLEAISLSQAAGLPVSSQMEDMLHRAMQASRARLTMTHPGGIWGSDLSPDGTLLATAGNDSTIHLWDAQTGQLIQSLTVYSAPVGGVTFSPAGQALASFSDDTTARIWDLASGETIQTLSGTALISYSPDGNLLATADYNSAADEYTVRIWDVSSQPTASRLLLELPGQRDPLDFSPDGVRLGTTSAVDYQTRIWDMGWCGLAGRASMGLGAGAPKALQAGKSKSSRTKRNRSIRGNPKG